MPHALLPRPPIVDRLVPFVVSAITSHQPRWQDDLAVLVAFFEPDARGQLIISSALLQDPRIITALATTAPPV